jgi:acetolactate synthase-1/2/3 large subunit
MKFLPILEERYVSDAIVDALAQGGVRYVLGMPGGLTGPLWKSLYRHPTIRTVQVREESIGALMAEAYGRFTGSPAVVMGQGEWIVGNAGQAYLEALLGSSPLLILTEMSDGASLSHHAPYQSGTGDYGTWDVRQALGGLTKRVMVSYSPVQAVQHTQLALKHALTGQPGPVGVVFHSSSLRGRVGPDTAPRIYDTRAYLPTKSRAVDELEVRSAAEALCESKRPVVVAGNGVRLGRATDQLARLATHLGLPVATTASGKGVFPETDPLALGVIGGFGWATANYVVGQADLVLAVGTKLGPSDTIDENTALLDPTRQTMIQIDVEPLNCGWTFPVDHVLIGEAGFVMSRLEEAVLADPRFALASGGARVEEARLHHGQFAATKGGPSDLAPFEPQIAIGIMEASLPEDVVITCDARENRLFMMQWYRSKARGEYLQPAAGGGMGYAVPAAMGAKLAEPGRPVLAVCGDGGFAMSIHALMTAVQEHLPIGVLIFNNGALGWVLHSMGSTAVAAEFAEFDHAQIARSLGCEGVTVASADDLRVALKDLTTITAPLVIDVPITLATSFRDIAHELLIPRQPAGNQDEVGIGQASGSTAGAGSRPGST